MFIPIAHWPRWVSIAGCGVLLTVAMASAEEKDAGRSAVAVVGQDLVSEHEVRRELRAAYGDEINVDQLPAATRQRAAQQVVDRRLVLQYLEEAKQAASAADVDYAIEQLRNELKAQGMTLTAYLKGGGWREEEFRQHLRWTFSWQRFLDRTLTEENLRKYFERHLPDFDGREVRVAHLLLKVEPDDEAGRKAALAEAGRILAEIQGGTLSFAEAVRKYSQAPTSAEGGELGFIRRHEPMPESFSKAALWLPKDQVSEPVVTNAGVHLIQCLEIRPGTRTWRESEQDLRRAVARYLFEWAAEKQRAKVNVGWNRNLAPGAAKEVKVSNAD